MANLVLLRNNSNMISYAMLCTKHLNIDAKIELIKNNSYRRSVS